MRITTYTKIPKFPESSIQRSAHPTINVWAESTTRKHYTRTPIYAFACIPNRSRAREPSSAFLGKKPKRTLANSTSGLQARGARSNFITALVSAGIFVDTTAAAWACLVWRVFSLPKARGKSVEEASFENCKLWPKVVMRWIWMSVVCCFNGLRS